MHKAGNLDLHGFFTFVFGNATQDLDAAPYGGAQFAALSDDWPLAVWEVASGRLLFLFESPVGLSYAENPGAGFDASGKRLAFATGHEACLYDLATGSVTDA